MLTVVVVDELRNHSRRRPILIYASSALVALYFVGGLYLTVEAATRTPLSSKMIASFARYRAQRETPPAPPLSPGSMIAGAEDFCDLSVIAEDQRALGGYALSRSLALDDAGWRSRMALNAYLLGMTPAEFRQRVLDEEYWGPLPDISPATVAAFMREYAEVARNPARVIDTYGVRYISGASHRQTTAVIHPKPLDTLPVGPILGLMAEELATEASRTTRVTSRDSDSRSGAAITIQRQRLS